jgi:hypothetical protein
MDDGQQERRKGENKTAGAHRDGERPSHRVRVKSFFFPLVILATRSRAFDDVAFCLCKVLQHETSLPEFPILLRIPWNDPSIWSIPSLHALDA